MSQSRVSDTDKKIRRTEKGEAEIKQRSLGLPKLAQVILLSIDGETTYAELLREFADESVAEVELSVDELLVKDLIVEDVTVAEEYTPLLIDNSDLMSAHIESFDSDEFFSSSLDPLHSGSGLVVDTGTNTMRSVNLKKKKQQSVYDVDIPLSLELDTNLKLKKEMRKSKLVQVFPVPEKTKKRRRSKRPKAPPINKWTMRIYIGLTGLGLLLVLIALVVKM
ncbi:hypothetical protein [Undibacterium sp. Ji22W]|uniref:hypothetical protein n=1 Tax=Undibacterium sp. Ji22W TaxID=3413038 RepID=UPI003BEFC389